MDYIKSYSTADVQAQAAYDVVRRTIPDHAHFFEIEINFELKPHTFRLLKNDSIQVVLIEASSGVAACKGFYHYLKYYCNSHISWDGNFIQIPEHLPSVAVTETSPSQFIYYQNVCTWSYSFAWWKWDDWQKHIDWIAMQGITLTLAPVQELVWEKVYLQLGLTKQEIDDHFSGPGFFAWQRMGNIRGWAGPLTSNFKKASSVLQKRIISALRDLGIAVALPAFAGHVPVAFKRIFPNASLTPAQRWNNFPDEFSCPLYIDPADELFHKVGTLFLRKIIDEYGGTNHIYFSDPFNEIQPRLRTLKYVSDASEGIFKAMTTVDSKATWLLQAWMFVKNLFWTDVLIKGFLTAVPKGRMLVLDLQSEFFPQYKRTKSFHGQPFIWCMLHNFGGTQGMHGSLDIVNEDIMGLHDMKNYTMVGAGITPEGINQNYVMYDFALDRGWYQNTVDVDKWLQRYTLTRYKGLNSELVTSGWHKLWVKFLKSL